VGRTGERENYQIVDKIKLPNAVDEAVFDPVNQYFYVESGSDEPGGKTHFINIIDAKELQARREHHASRQNFQCYGCGPCRREALCQ